MRSIDLIKAQASETRVYRTTFNIADDLMWHVNDFNARLPGTNWHEFCQALPKNPDGSHDMALRHMIHWGKADARVIEDAFQVTLPPSVHAFYAEIQEAVLNWSHTYHIMRPEHVVAWEREYRELSEDTDLPVRLIRFCKMPVTGVSIAFRQHPQTDAWNIGWTSVDDLTEELQSLAGDFCMVAEDLDQWLVHLLDNDGVSFSDQQQWFEKVR